MTDDQLRLLGYVANNPVTRDEIGWSFLDGSNPNSKTLHSLIRHGHIDVQNSIATISAAGLQALKKCQFPARSHTAEMMG